MITISVKGNKGVKDMLAAYPKKASRAMEMALDATAKLIRDDIKATMPTVFDEPTPFTLNSLKVTPTHGHNMQASVWFKEPARMGEHYLVPQVEGGKRKLKGFERGAGVGPLVPTKVGAKLDRYGNVSMGQIRQIMSVLGLAEASAGYAANKTAASSKRNKKVRDFVVVKPGNRGRLPAGIYERFQTGVGFGAKTKRTFIDQSRAYQKGKTVGKISSVIRARGLRPVLLTGNRGAVKPLLNFYGIAGKTFNARLEGLFWDKMAGTVKQY